MAASPSSHPAAGIEEEGCDGALRPPPASRLNLTPRRCQGRLNICRRVDAECPSCVHDSMADDGTLHLTTNSPEAEAVSGERLVDFEVFFDREKAGLFRASAW